MTYQRCDVCRDEHDALSGKISTVVARMNLERCAVPETGAGVNYVQVTLDLCGKPACKRAGISQLAETLEMKAWELAGVAERQLQGVK